MSLTNFKVFTAFAYKTAIELLSYNINLFNTATKGGFVLTTAANLGDFNDAAMYSRIDGLVRRRNAYATGTVAHKALAMLQESSVKVAAGTPPIDIDPHWFQWIQKSPQEAGVVLGKQLAEEMLNDMLAVAVKAYAAAMGQISTMVYDGTAANSTLGGLLTGASKMGDRASAISCWVTHSKPMFDIYGTALTNAAQLFVFGNTTVSADSMGRPFVIADLPDLKVADGVSSGVDMYRTLGLTSGAVVIEQNNDFLDNYETSNGDENIKRTYQAQWSFNVAVKGFSWDKTNGGKSPTDAAVATATNWDRIATADKDLAGVLVTTR